MNKHNTLRLAVGFMPLLFVSSALATDYQWTGSTNSLAGGTGWSPSGAGITVGSDVTPAAGDKLVQSAGDIVAGGSINIVAGAEYSYTVAGQHNILPTINIAGTGTDGQGALKNMGNDWMQIASVNLTSNATVQVASGGWRHQDFGTGRNELKLNGNTLTVRGGSSAWFVGTTITGPGVMDVNVGGEFNFEGSSVIPAGVTMQLSGNTRSSSWDGAGQTHSGEVKVLDRGILENRQNDGGKTFAGTLTIGSDAGSTAADELTLRVSTENGTSNNFMNVTGKITGPGTLVRDGINTEKVFLKNGANDYQGGTKINSGILVKDADGAIPANNIQINGGTLDLNGYGQSMTSGHIKGNVTGNGSVLGLDGPGVKDIKTGANISVPVEVSGGVVKAEYNAGNNALSTGVTGTLLVTGDATLKPYQDDALAAAPGLHEYRRVGADLNTDDGTTGAIYGGVKPGIPAIDSTAKPYGDNNKFVYTGEIVNTTAAAIGVTFGEQYDDQIRVKVDGNTVLLDTGWNTATASGVVNLTPGAHSIEISSFDGVGGAGPNSGWDKGVGILVGAYTITQVNGGPVDNAAFSKISLGTLPAGITLNAPGQDLRQDRSESKNIEIDAGATLTVDTSELYGKKYTLTGSISGGGDVATRGSVVLAGANTAAGNLKVQTGTTWAANNAAVASFASIDVAAGANLNLSALTSVSLTGPITGNGTIVTAPAGLTVTSPIAPGNSIGALAVTGNLNATTFNMEIDVPGIQDEVNVTGILNVAGATLNVTSLPGTTGYAAGNSWDLFDFASATGSFATINTPALSGTLTWDTSALLTTGTISIIPETSTALTSLITLGVFALRRRRK